jgi:hypothetical protein
MIIGNLDVYGIIYKITNSVNGKVYIGQTTRNFYKRYNYGADNDIERIYKYHKKFKENNYGSYNKHLLESFEKYGLENFKINKYFDIAFTQEELDIKEIMYIQLYDSYKNGYNNTIGGQGSSGREYITGIGNMLNKPVIQISKKGEFIKEWGSIAIASNELGINHSRISQVCNHIYGRKSTGGFMWMFKDEYIISDKIKYQNNIGEYNKRKIVKLDLQGNFIELFDSMSDKKLKNDGFLSSKISQCCLGKRKTHKGYIWIYYEDFIDDKIPIYNSNHNGENKAIVLLTLNNEFVKEFKSMSEAYKETNIPISLISRCCNKIRRSTNGFKFIFKNEYKTINI